MAKMDFSGKRQDYSKERQAVIGNCVLFPKNVICTNGNEPKPPKTDFEIAAAKAQRNTQINEKISRAFKDVTNIPILNTAREVAAESEKKIEQARRPIPKIVFNGIKTFEEAQEGIENEVNPLDETIPIVSENPENKTE